MVARNVIEQPTQAVQGCALPKRMRDRALPLRFLVQLRPERTRLQPLWQPARDCHRKNPAGATAELAN